VVEVGRTKKGPPPLSSQIELLETGKFESRALGGRYSFVGLIQGAGRGLTHLWQAFCVGRGAQEMSTGGGRKRDVTLA